MVGQVGTQVVEPLEPCRERAVAARGVDGEDHLIDTHQTIHAAPRIAHRVRTTSTPPSPCGIAPRAVPDRQEENLVTGVPAGVVYESGVRIVTVAVGTGELVIQTASRGTSPVTEWVRRPLYVRSATVYTVCMSTVAPTT